MADRQQEQQAFTRFCWHASLRHDDFEFVDAPDFQSKCRSVGVELVEYHADADVCRSSATRASEEDLRALAREACDRWQEISKQGRCVYLFPRLGVRPSLRGRRELVEELVDVVLKTDVPSNYVQYPADGKLWRSIHAFSVGLPMPSSAQSTWQVVEVVIGDAKPSAVRALIKKKEVLLPAYQQRVKKSWLLVHSSARPCVGDVDLGRPSTCGILGSDTLSDLFGSLFDGVYYFDDDSDELLLLAGRN